MRPDGAQPQPSSEREPRGPAAPYRTRPSPPPAAKSQHEFWDGTLAAPRPKGAPDALGRERQGPEAHAGEARQRVGDGRAYRNEAPLARALGAEGAAAIRVLHEVALELGRRIVGARHAIDEQRAVQEVAVLVEHLLEESVAEPLDDAALVLPLEEPRVDRASDVGDRDVALDPHRARLLVHAHLGCADRHFPERRAAAERRGGTPGRDHAAADQLAAGHSEPEHQHLGIRETSRRRHDRAVLEGEITRRYAKSGRHDTQELVADG